MRIAIIQLPMWGVDVPSLGLASLSGWLKKHDFEVNVFDLNLSLFMSVSKKNKKYFNHQYNDFWDKDLSKISIINDNLIEKWIKKILNFNPDLLCFPIFLTTRELSLKFAKKFKQKNPNVLIVFGGPDCVQGRNFNQIVNYGCVDVIVHGEGEKTILEISQMWEEKNLKICDGAVILKNKEKIIGKERKQIENLDILPLPDYSDFNLKEYTLKNNFAIMMTRGCPMKCIYCSEGEYWKKSRTRSGESVYNEMAYVSKKYNGKYFHFGDCMINTNLKEVSNLCDLLIKNKTNVNWKVKVYPDKRLDYKIMKKMRDAGCVTWELGVESGSDKLIKEMGRNYNVSIVKNILKIGKEVGIDINTFWMIGFPTETDEDFEKTLFFLEEIKDYIKIDPPCVSIFQILGDTPFYKKVDDFEIIDYNNKNWYTKKQNNSFLIRDKRYKKFFECANKLNLLNKDVYLNG